MAIWTENYFYQIQFRNEVLEIMKDFTIDLTSLPPRWTDSTLTSIKNILTHAEKTKHPLLVVLPPETNPSAMAAFASLLFLPNMQEPPVPHCKIALAPGRYFVRDLMDTFFTVQGLHRTIQKVRVNSSYQRLPPTMEKLNNLLKNNPNKNVYFHWVWRCNRVWEHYNSIKEAKLSPRGYFGRDDKYDSVIDIIESEYLACSSVKNRHYDMLVYCPFYHSFSYGGWVDKIDHVEETVKNFNADRKIVVVRSPYGFWAQKLEGKLKAPGFISVTAPPSSSREPIKIQILDSVLSVEESQILYRLIQKNWGKLPIEERTVIKEIRDILRKTLVFLSPLSKEEANSIANGLEQVFKTLDLNLIPNGDKVVQKLLEWLRSNPENQKLSHILELSKSLPLEVWVTHRLDQKALEDSSDGETSNLQVKLTDGRMKFLGNRSGNKTVLSRVDRKSDLDWVSHLAPGDIIILSSWEVVTRAWTIENLWERSEQWRSNSVKEGIISESAKGHDPMLELADFITKQVKDVKALLQKDSDEDIDQEDLWWDNIYKQGTTTTPVAISSLPLDKNGIDAYEARFEDATGICFSESHDVQIYREAEDESEILTISAEKLMINDVAIISKDEERGNILDIIMEHLEESPKLGPYAICVKDWKDALRIGFHKRGGSVSNIRKELIDKGCRVDPMTVKSWVVGTIMAPQDKSHIKILAEVLEVENIDFELLDTSLVKLRVIPRVIGRLLNQFITDKSLSPEKKRELEKLILDSGLDPDVIRNSIDTKKIISISKEPIKISPSFANKLFTYAS